MCHQPMKLSDIFYHNPLILLREYGKIHSDQEHYDCVLKPKDQGYGKNQKQMP